MNTTPKRFDNAIAALVKAYLEGTLLAGSCVACACAVIIAQAVGATLVYDSAIRDCQVIGPQFGVWYDALFYPNAFNEHGLDEIEKTGYSTEEFVRIEQAFEGETSLYGVHYQDYTSEQVAADLLVGLHAVVDVLCEIESITDTAPYKAQFDRATEGKSLPLANIIVG